MFTNEKKEEEKITKQPPPKIETNKLEMHTTKNELTPKVNVTPPIQEKISIFKADKKKVAVSTVKK